MAKNFKLFILGYRGFFISALLFHLSFFGNIPASHAVLTKDEIHDFYEKGYVIVRQLYTPAEIDQISSYANRLENAAEELGKSLDEKATTQSIMHKGTQFVLKKEEGRTEIHRLVWVGAAEPMLLQLGRKKELLECVGQLLKTSEGDHLINQLHFKRPDKDKSVRFNIHQDIENRVSFDPDWQDVNGQGSFVQTLTAVDEMTEQNGPLKVINGLPKEGNLGLKNKTPEEREQIASKYGPWQTLTLKPGDVLLMHPLSIHKSDVTQASEPSDKRRLFINGFACPEANKKPYPGKGSCERIKFPPVLKEKKIDRL